MRYNSKCQSEAPLSSPSPREGRVIIACFLNDFSAAIYAGWQSGVGLSR
jgi:hypothetical protein